MTFPVLWQGNREYHADLERLACPRTVPLWLVKQHETRAMRNHGGQTLARLAERGGLAPCELCAVLEDRPWKAMPTAESVRVLHDLIAVAPTSELTVQQIAHADAEGVMHVDSDGYGWVPRRWLARLSSTGHVTCPQRLCAERGAP